MNEEHHLGLRLHQLVSWSQDYLFQHNAMTLFINWHPHWLSRACRPHHSWLNQTLPFVTFPPLIISPASSSFWTWTYFFYHAFFCPFLTNLETISASIIWLERALIPLIVGILHRPDYVSVATRHPTDNLQPNSLALRMHPAINSRDTN